MKDETRHALNALNRAFYDERGAAFDASRDHPWPGWTRVLPWMDAGGPAESTESAEPLRVLDLGCGNGRFGHFLWTHRLGGPIDYLGIDSSEGLLVSARRTLGGARPDFRVRLDKQDLIAGDGPEALPPGPFDLIAVFGVLHHVPGEDMRQRLVRALASRLAPGGTLVLTAWQFGSDARFERTIWSSEAVATQARELGFDADDLEPGDHLLGFAGDRSVPRFCHFINEDEFDRLTRDLPLDERTRFREDGRSADLNAYRVLQKAD